MDRLHIKFHPPVSIEKPFSKTHAPVIGIGVGTNTSAFRQFKTKRKELQLSP